MDTNRDTLKSDWRGSGFMKPVSAFMNSIARKVNNMHWVRGAEVHIRKDFIAFEPLWWNSPYKAIFDLYDVIQPSASDVTKVATVKIRGLGANTLIPIAGNFVTVGTGLAGEELDTDIDIADDTYFYLNVDREHLTATLESDSGSEVSGVLKDGTDPIERVYLWWIPWDATNEMIDEINIMDLRPITGWTQ